MLKLASGNLNDFGEVFKTTPVLRPMLKPSQYRVSAPFNVLLFCIDTLGGFVTLPFRRFYTIDHASIKKILLIRLDYIGDVLVTTPAIRALRKKYPEAAIDVVCRPLTAQLLRANPNVTTVIPFDPPWLKHMGGVKLWDTIRTFWDNATVRRLKEERYDLVIEFHTDPRNILLSWIIQGRYRIGHADRGLGFLLTHPIPYEDSGHIIDRTNRIVQYLGCGQELPTLDLYLSSEDESEGQRVMKEHWLRKREFICLNPGTGRINKRWALASWSELADAIIDKYGVTAAFTGSTEDLLDIYQIIGAMRNSKRTVVLAGKTSLGGLAEVYRHAKAVICTDTGPMHIAKSVGARLVALFGPVNPIIWGYTHSTSRVVVEKQTCSFCDRPDCIRKTEQYLCMTQIQPAGVLAQLKSVL